MTIVLGIETSCDETGVGLVRGRRPARRRARLEHGRARPLRRRRARDRRPRAPAGDGADGAGRARQRPARARRRRRGRRDRRARGWRRRCTSAWPRRRPTRSRWACRSTACTTWPGTPRPTRSSTGRCPTVRGAASCPAGTPRCCSSATSSAPDRPPLRHRRRRRGGGVRQGRRGCSGCPTRAARPSTARPATATPRAIAVPPPAHRPAATRSSGSPSPGSRPRSPATSRKQPGRRRHRRRGAASRRRSPTCSPRKALRACRQQDVETPGHRRRGRGEQPHPGARRRSGAPPPASSCAIPPMRLCTDNGAMIAAIGDLLVRDGASRPGSSSPRCPPIELRQAQLA